MHTHTHYPSDVVQTLFFNTSPQSLHHYYLLLIIVLLYKSKAVFLREHRGVSGELDTKLSCHLFLALPRSLLPSGCSPRAILISLSSPTLYTWSLHLLLLLLTNFIMYIMSHSSFTALFLTQSFHVFPTIVLFLFSSLVLTCTNDSM